MTGTCTGIAITTGAGFNATCTLGVMSIALRRRDVAANVVQKTYYSYSFNYQDRAMQRASAALGQGYPSKPVKVIVPFTAGSATDILARTVGQQLTELWGQPVIVDNRPGGGGRLGTQAAANSPADGYTDLFTLNTNYTIDKSMFKTMMYDPEKAFEAITIIAFLLWIVAALIVGSVIYLSALERTRDFAVFKAVGVSTRSVLGGLALQAILVAIVAAVLGALLSVALAPLFPMRVVVPVSAFLSLPVIAIVIGLLASAAGLRRAVTVDPALAFGGP